MFLILSRKKLTDWNTDITPLVGEELLVEILDDVPLTMHNFVSTDAIFTSKGCQTHTQYILIRPGITYLLTMIISVIAELFLLSLHIIIFSPPVFSETLLLRACIDFGQNSNAKCFSVSSVLYI